MPHATPSVIHVIVAGGVDWPAIGATVATVIAAVLGISGTAWQAERGRRASSNDLKASLSASIDNLKLGINAENDRARRSEKRQAYVNFQTVLNRFIVATDRLLNYDPRAARPGRDELVHAVADSSADLQNALSSLMLAAPEHLRNRADEAVQLLSSYSQQVELGRHLVDKSDDFRRIRNDLYTKMRDDLGTAELTKK